MYNIDWKDPPPTFYEAEQKFREEGREEGRGEGIQLGIEKNRRETAKNLIQEGIPIEIIAKTTKLSVEEIRKL